jgi:hypothetical protein
MGYHEKFVTKVEIKERRIDVAEFYFFAKALGLDPFELFKTYVERINAEAKQRRTPRLSRTQVFSRGATEQAEQRKVHWQLSRG